MSVNILHLKSANLLRLVAFKAVQTNCPYAELCTIHILLIHKFDVNFRSFKEKRAGGSVEM